MRNFKRYDGNEFKFGITFENANYIIKAYGTNEQKVYSEYVAQRFIRGIGIPCQEVWIGTYRGLKVNIIKDFTTEDAFLHQFKDTRQQSEGIDLTSKSYTYNDVLDLIEKHTKMSQNSKQAMLVQFWDMFICDAILGNRDRHHGNWGYIAHGNSYYPAPIFDNGGSLFPDISARIHEYTKENEKKFLFDRSEQFPAQLFRLERADGSVKRTNYYEMLGNLKFDDTFKREVESIRKNIGYLGVRQVTVKILKESGSMIPDKYKRFYLRIILMRYLHIIERRTLEDCYKIINNNKR